MANSSPTQLVRNFLEGPLTRPSLMQWRQRQFLSRQGFASYFGTFASFAEARHFLPPSREFDEEALTAEYVSVRTRKIFTYDYPVLWWLSSAFGSGSSSILDIGGSVGVHHYAYRQWLQMPEDLRWSVVEVPEVVRVGRRLAEAQAARALSFSTDLPETVSRTEADIWIAAGSLQYLETPPLRICFARLEGSPGTFSSTSCRCMTARISSRLKTSAIPASRLCTSSTARVSSSPYWRRATS